MQIVITCNVCVFLRECLHICGWTGRPICLVSGASVPDKRRRYFIGASFGFKTDTLPRRRTPGVFERKDGRDVKRTLFPALPENAEDDQVPGGIAIGAADAGCFAYPGSGVEECVGMHKTRLMLLILFTNVAQWQQS
jgi:hypothetical protein